MLSANYNPYGEKTEKTEYNKKSKHDKPRAGGRDSDSDTDDDRYDRRESKDRREKKDKKERGGRDDSDDEDHKRGGRDDRREEGYKSSGYGPGSEQSAYYAGRPSERQEQGRTHYNDSATSMPHSQSGNRYDDSGYGRASEYGHANEYKSEGYGKIAGTEQSRPVTQTSTGGYGVPTSQYETESYGRSSAAAQSRPQMSSSGYGQANQYETQSYGKPASMAQNRPIQSTGGYGQSAQHQGGNYEAPTATSQSRPQLSTGGYGQSTQYETEGYARPTPVSQSRPVQSTGVYGQSTQYNSESYGKPTATSQSRPQVAAGGYGQSTQYETGTYGRPTETQQSSNYYGSSHDDSSYKQSTLSQTAAAYGAASQYGNDSYRAPSSQYQSIPPRPSYTEDRPEIKHTPYGRPATASYQETSARPDEAPLVAKMENLTVDQTPCPPALAFPSIPSEGFYGPYVRFTGTTSNTWTGSILVVVASNTAAPRLLINVGRASQPIRLATYYNLTFYRFDLSIPQSRSETPITYSVNNKEYRFVVPALGQDWRMLFTSCNGFSLDVDAERQKVEGGIQPLWRDVMEQHAKKPFHVQLGGGDQLYCDEVFLLVPELVQWLEIKDKAQKESSMFNGAMVQNTERYYIMNYLKHFSQEIYKDALAGVPYVFNMDDHDAFDGYGSYPKYLQTHSIITGVGTTAIRFYLLFQHHTTPELARKDGYFGERGYNFIRVMGERAAVLGIDTRSERCLENVVTYDSWKMIEQQLQTIPTFVKHLISIVGIPVTYPRLKGEQFLEVAADVTKTATNFLEKASGFWQSFAKKNQNQGEAVDLAAVFKKTGAYTNILNHFGEGELLDDLNDHWTCDLHDAERKKMVDMLVAFARDRHCRSTILSGDVHCCGISLFSTPTSSNVSDPTFIPNVISSGIGNIPPPKAVITGLHRCYSPLDCRLPTNGVVKESMVELFQQDVDGTPLSDKLLLGRRNWAVVEMLGESLRVEIRVEGPGKKVEEVRGYQFLVPNLE